jgi:putative Holliday junction resolvase
MGKIAGLDFGLKRTGVALTDELQIIASPLTTVDSNELIGFLKNLIQMEKLERIVIGEPTRMDSSDTHISENVRLLKAHLEKEFPLVPISMVDERFTSKMASMSMVEMGMKKKKREEKGNIDMISAAIILQSYLDSRQL